MTIPVTCICGERYPLKDEWGGRRVTCPICKSIIDVPDRPAGAVRPAPAVLAASPQRPVLPVVSRAMARLPVSASPALIRPVTGAPASRSRGFVHGYPGVARVTVREDLIGMYHHPLFRRDLFFIHQRMFQIDAKYHVYDESGLPIAYVRRPAYVPELLLVYLVFAIVVGIGLAGALGIPGVARVGASFPGMALLLMLPVVLLAWTAAMAVNPLRHITIYQDESRSYPLLRILQDTRFQYLHTNFTVILPTGEIVGYLRKPRIYNILRKRWNWYDANGELVCIAREDSLILSMLRRLFGDLSWFIRTNYHFFHPDTEIVIGEFNRKLTIDDRYVLDLRMDPEHYLDRRMALALGILLDVGERR